MFTPALRTLDGDELGETVVANRSRRFLAVAAAIAVIGASIVGGETSSEPAAAAPVASTAVASAESAESASARALSGSEFNPGLIISDALFFDANAMTQAEIQSFLTRMVGSCANEYCLAAHRTSSVSKAADAWCDAYAGSANETAAQIIYKVQRACGVSARVILVTLQKEQSLITRSAPSAGAVRIAMGYGCPDTAACDSTYYGFFNQVYQAARQFKRYGQPGTGLTWYPVGQVSAVRHHPDPTCGSVPVLIQNRATAALYYYTPYTPNAAALANLEGTGDVCSSYGNRNFWRFFNSWFGNSLAGAGDAAIAAVYNSNKDLLGAPVGSSNCGTRSSCYQHYANGAIYWMVSTGGIVISGDYWTEFKAQNYGSGTLGYPTGAPISVTGGAGMPFQFGTIYKSAAGTFAVIKPLRDTYWANGSNSSPLGWPTARQECAGSVCSQPFQGGVVVNNGTTGRTIVGAAYVAAFTRAGGVATMGMPTGAMVTIPDSPHGAGTGQSFTSGTIFSTAHGTYAVPGEMKVKYSQTRSYLGPLGWPIGDRECTSRGCQQDFQYGAIFASDTTGAKVVMSDYLTVWKNAGGMDLVGFPTIDRVTVANPAHGNGEGQTFQNGTIYSSAAGTYAVLRPMRELYFQRGGNGGALGWPIAAQTCTDSQCSQRFQGGTLTTTNAYNAVYRYWLATGGPSGPLGSPVADVVSMPQNGGGFGQTFQKGTVLSSAAGTFAVLLPLRTEYNTHGSYAGEIGWPTSEQTCELGECVQTFQRGTVFWSQSRGGRAVIGEFHTLYAGGDSGLGVPLADRIDIPAGPNGAGTGQSFSNGTIYKGSGAAVVVLKPMRDVYASARSYNGALGWPTKPRVCDGDECVQEFQGGFAFSGPNGGWPVTGAYATAYRAIGGWATLGAARSGLVAVTTASNGNGSGQVFARGAIYSSAAGTYAMTAAIRAEYLAIGSNAGVAGWPTGPRTCSDDECTQTFQNAIIFESQARGARAVTGDYLKEFTRVGGTAAIGVPTSKIILVTGNPNGDGQGQTFSNGTIYSSAHGTWAVLRPLRDAYFAAGSNAGSYGWPVGPQVCQGGTCSQEFQGGTITV